jgi:hypothetical protein
MNDSELEAKRIYDRAWRVKNREKLRAQNKAWRMANPEKVHRWARTWQLNNPQKVRVIQQRTRVVRQEHRREMNSRWTKANAQKVNERNRRWRLTNPDKVKESNRKAYLKRFEQVRDCSKKRRVACKKQINQHFYNRLKSDVRFRLSHYLRTRINTVLKGQSKSARTIELVGISIEGFKAHLESQFKDGMSWGNYSFKGWHIDHIVPCASYDLTDPEQQKQCFHYTNLQPLWWWENLAKGDKIAA